MVQGFGDRGVRRYCHPKGGLRGRQISAVVQGAPCTGLDSQKLSWVLEDDFCLPSGER